jgi:hypothetical protein
MRKDTKTTHLFEDGDNCPAFFTGTVTRVEAILGDVEVQGREGDVRKVDDRVHDCFVKSFSQRIS